MASSLKASQLISVSHSNSEVFIPSNENDSPYSFNLNDYTQSTPASDVSRHSSRQTLSPLSSLNTPLPFSKYLARPPSPLKQSQVSLQPNQEDEYYARPIVRTADEMKRSHGPPQMQKITKSMEGFVHERTSQNTAFEEWIMKKAVQKKSSTLELQEISTNPKKDNVFEKWREAKDLEIEAARKEGRRKAQQVAIDAQLKAEQRQQATTAALLKWKLAKEQQEKKIARARNSNDIAQKRTVPRKAVSPKIVPPMVLKTVQHEQPWVDLIPEEQRLVRDDECYAFKPSAAVNRKGSRWTSKCDGGRCMHKVYAC